MISKITDDFEKIVEVKKLKELKRYVKNILPNYKKWKINNQKQKNKRIREKINRRKRNEKWEIKK